MIAQRLFPILASFAVALLLTSCKDSPSAPNEPNNPLVGTWLVESVNGESAAEAGATWLFTATTASYTQAIDGCQGRLSYTISGNKLFTTITQEGCGSVPAGSRDTATFQVNGARVTLTGTDGSSTVLRRMSGADRVIGTWQVTKVEGKSPKPGVEVRLFFNDRVFAMNTRSAEVNCNTVFAYQNDGTRLAIEVIADECSELPEGSQDVVTWTEKDNNLTLTFSDGTTMEARRL